MKKKIIYIVILLLLFGLMYWFNKQMPRQFVWKPTYSTNDHQPFGSYVFDEMLSASWEKGYSHSYYNINRLLAEDSLQGKNLLVVTQTFDSNKDEIKRFLDYIEKGGQALIMADYFDKNLSDTLGFKNRNYVGLLYEIFSPESNKRHEDIYYCASSLRQKKYEIPTLLTSSYFEITDTLNAVVVAVKQDTLPVMLRFQIGKGNILVGCIPGLFTNYGILDDKNNEYVWTALAYLKGKPLVRTEFFMKKQSLEGHENKSASPLRYLLNNRALRWALFLTLISILVFMIFTAKRKQRAIPVIKDPENRMLKFVRSISILYLRKNNNADIVRKKYIYWADTLKREYALDIINEPHDSSFFSRFSVKTGFPLDKTRSLFKSLDQITKDSHITDDTMISLINIMDSLK
jgi:hypothetical protein